MNIVRMEDGLIFLFRCRHKVNKKIFRKERRGTQKREEKRDREIETKKEKQQQRQRERVKDKTRK